jgi:hypothetical protein
MKIAAIVAIIATATMASCQVIAESKPYVYNPNSYGAPTLYHSHESIQQRNELELLQKANDLAEKRFNLEVEHLRQEEIERAKPYGDEIHE